MFETIEDTDYYCWLNNKAVIVHRGKFCGLVSEYEVGQNAKFQNL